MIRPTPLRIINGQVVWPYSLSQLRQDEPTRSFSSGPSDRELEAFQFIYPEATTAPDPDPAAEKVAEVQPVEIDGQWVQQWEVVALSVDEAAAYYRATHPPRWVDFGSVVMAMAEIKALLNQGIAIGESPLAMGLAVGLGKAADGDSRVFLGAWRQASAAGLIPLELVAGLQALAAAHDLPAEFIAGLAA